MDHLTLLEGEVVAMVDALRAADPGAPVPSCPGWTVRELAGHITGIHRWVLAALSSQTPPPYDGTATDGDLAEVYAAAGEAMVAALRDLPPDHPCWTFDKGNQSASFWRRRQVHEVAVHRWDVAPYVLSDEIAEDGIDEALDLMLPRQLALGRLTLPPGRLHLVSPTRSWSLGEGAPEATLHGSASDLLLSLWGRGTPRPDPWRDAALTP
ncbi:MAG: hypothetical protein JWM02_3345 [Frankiales bacterium]|nr:hypothetical protein [Frankiales bacterium]